MHCDIDCVGFVHCSVLVYNFRLRKQSVNFDLSKMYWQHAMYAFVLMLKQYQYHSALVMNAFQRHTNKNYSFDLTDFLRAIFSLYDDFESKYTVNKRQFMLFVLKLLNFCLCRFLSLQRQSIKFNSVAFRTENNHKHFN